MADPARQLPADAGLGEVRTVRSLGGGESADTWLVDTGAGRAVLRVDRPLAERLGLDREAELELLRHVSAAGFAPPILHADPRRGLLVTRFLPQRNWSPADFERAEQLQRIGARLRELHGLCPRGKRFDPAAICAGYARRAGSRLASELARQVASLSGELYADSDRLCVCHNDPISENIIDSTPVQFIDWEYAAVGDPLFDLAVMIRHHSLDARRSDQLLEAWLGSSPDRPLRRRLGDFCSLYDLVAALWRAVVESEPRVGS